MFIFQEKFNRLKRISIFLAILFLSLNLFNIHRMKAEGELPLEKEEVEEIIEPVIEKQCTDYDEGKNYYEKSKAEIRELDVEAPLIETEYDICNEDGSLKEWYCEETEEGTFLYGEIFYCPNGCQNGACITTDKQIINNYAQDNNLLGKLLLQVEDRGRIWYIDFEGNKHEVTFNNALNLFETLATGITNNDLYQIPYYYDNWNSYLGNSLKGKLLLQVEDHGRIWYIDFEGKRHEVTWNNLMSLFESLSLGITNEDLNQIGTYHDYDNDGLTDSEELNFYKTNPYDADSDNDGYSDGDEVANGYNPLGESMNIYSNELVTSLVYSGDDNDNFNSFYKYGNYIYAVGDTWSEGQGQQNILIVKFNENDLSIVEKKVYGESGNEYLKAIKVDKDYIYAVGSSDVLGEGQKEALLMKIDKNSLKIVDQVVYGGIKDDVFLDLYITDDVIYAVGHTKSVRNIKSDALIVSFNKKTLELIEKNIYAGISTDIFNSLYVDGNYIYAVGTTQSTGVIDREAIKSPENPTYEELYEYIFIGTGNKDSLLVKFNQDLEVVERKILGNVNDNFLTSVYVDEDYVYVTGQSKVITRAYGDAVVGRFNKENLDEVEFKAYGSSFSNDYFQDVYVDDNYIYVAGTVGSSRNRNLDAAIVRISKDDFSTKKSKVFSSSKNDIFNDIYFDGNYIYAVGQTKLGDFYDAILSKIITLEKGFNNTVPENFIWEDSNLDFFDIHLISTNSSGLDLSDCNLELENYIVLGSDSFSEYVEEEEEEVDEYTITLATTTMNYNVFDVNIAPPLEGLEIENFIFTEDEAEVIVSNVTESELTEELITYTIQLSIDENFEGFVEGSAYEVSVIEFTEEEEEEVKSDVLILNYPLLTSGYRDSTMTDSNLSIYKYVVKDNNNGSCENYACCSNADCDDGDDNTIDICVNPYFDNAYCKNELIPSTIECLSDIDCDDGISCTTNICNLETNTCSYQEILENINNDGCCLSSVWSYEFVPWKLDNDCDVALQTNSSLIINTGKEITELSSNNPQSIILLQEFVYDEDDDLNHGSKILIGKLEIDNTYTSYNNYSGDGVLVLEIINSGVSLEDQILSIDINGIEKNIYLPSVDSSISSEVGYYIADDGSTYYSLYKGSGVFMSPLEAFIEQNLAQENIDF